MNGARVGNLAGIGMTSERTRARMVERQLASRGVTDPRVLAAMRAVPRHLFVDDALAHRAYEDTSLPINFGQTIAEGTPKEVAANPAVIEAYLGSDYA